MVCRDCNSDITEHPYNDIDYYNCRSCDACACNFKLYGCSRCMLDTCVDCLGRGALCPDCIREVTARCAILYKRGAPVHAVEDVNDKALDGED